MNRLASIVFFQFLSVLFTIMELLKQVLHFRFSFEPRFSEVAKTLFIAPPLCATSCNVDYSGSILYDNERETWSKSKPNRAIGDRTKKTILPKISLINARSLLLKLDELTASLSITQSTWWQLHQTWFSEDIDDSLASIHGYNLFVRTALIAEWVACAYIYPSLSIPNAEPISKMIISIACGFGAPSLFN
jgi:hypothetical protein